MKKTLLCAAVMVAIAPLAMANDIGADPHFNASDIEGDLGFNAPGTEPENVIPLYPQQIQGGNVSKNEGIENDAGFGSGNPDVPFFPQYPTIDGDVSGNNVDENDNGFGVIPEDPDDLENLDKDPAFGVVDNAIRDAITDLEETVDQNAENIDRNYNAIIETAGKVNRNEERLDVHDDRINANAQQIEANKQAMIDGDKKLQESIDAEVANRQAADAELRKDINTNTDAIASHYTEMKNNFASVNQRIDDLDDEMNKGFAAQAALSGLFQPYNVGKFNLTGGFGTYESEVGIALGMGYRVNENFAVKAGVATNASDFDTVTTNASFNIEW